MNFMGTYGLILALCLIFLFGSEATSNPTSIDFSYATFESPEGIETLGNATFENNVLQLTAGGLAYSVGKAVYSEPIKIWDRSTGLTLSFKTTFTFSVNRSDTNQSGDGLAFGLFPYKLIPNNSGGRYLGLYNTSSSKNNHGVAVEFDLYKNKYDPDNNHVGLDLKNIRSACMSTLRNYGLNLGAGNNINVEIDYDGPTGRLNVYAINASLGDPGITNLVLSCQLNISRYIHRREVFVGFSAATNNYSEYHTIHSWTFKAWIAQPSQRRNKIMVATLVVSIFSVGLLLGILFYILRKKRIKIPLTIGNDDVRSNPTSDLSKEITRACDWDVFPKKFSYEELNRATNNFDPKELLGEGGFGDVYKGIIRCANSDRAIAVKRFSQSSSQSDREYLSEVVMIGRLRHRNLVQLQGWCHQGGELLLVYDYMPNGSVDQLLYETDSSSEILDWPKRLKICRGLAAALLYLHEECQYKVVHRDVKTSNVMVDSDYEARLGDFGLARFVEISNYTASLTTSIGGGTIGYIAPERSVTGKATLESDVFSYGAVLLEIACGRRPIEISTTNPDEAILVERVWKLLKEDKLLQAADPSLRGLFDVHEMERVLTIGLLCSSPDPLDRPTIRQALRFLNFEAPLPALPPEKPMYYRGSGVSGFGAWEHGKIDWNHDNSTRKIDDGKGDEEDGSISRSDEASTADIVSLKSLSSAQVSVERYF